MKLSLIYSVIGLVLLLAVLLIAYLLWRRRGKVRPYDLETNHAEFDRWKIHYHMSGRGEPLLLIHGIGASLYCWRWILPLLRDHFKVVALDLPGFGQSSKPTDVSYGLDEQCERILQFLDTLKIKRFHVVGNSMGGNIALWLALVAPERVMNVGVIGPATSPSLAPLDLGKWLWLSRPVSLLMNRTAMRWAHRRTVSRREKVDDTRIEQSFMTYGRRHEAVRSFMLATEAIRDVRLLPSLKKIKHEVLVLWGTGDRLVPRRVIDRLVQTLPHSESYQHVGGGHHLQEDEPEWVAEKIIRSFS